LTCASKHSELLTSKEDTMVTKKDLFYFLHLDYLLFVGHQLPDRDVSCAMYMFCEAFGLSWKDARIRLLFVKNGEEYLQDGFFHTDQDRWIPFSDEVKKADDDNEENETAENPAQNGVKRSRVMIVHFDTGRKLDPWTPEKFKVGQRVFFYDHHGDVDNGFSATGIVFRMHEDRLRESPRYEHLKVMTAFIDAKDYGKEFDGRNEYEMRNLYGLADLLRGLNYLQTGERTKKDDAYFAEAVIAAFYSLDAFMSVRLMFGRNFNEAKKGTYKTLFGVRLYYHDFSDSGVNGQTARIFFGKPPYLDGKQQVDCIITKHRERIQLVIYHDDYKTPEHLDTTEIQKRLQARYPELDDSAIYNDNRDFCLYITSDEVALDVLIMIVEDLIEQRKDKFVSQMLDDQQEMREEIELIASIRGTDQQSMAWRTYYHSLAPSKQLLAMRIFLQAMSDRGADETNSMVLEQ